MAISMWQKNQNQLHLQDDQPLATRGTRSLLAVSLTINIFIFQSKKKDERPFFRAVKSESLTSEAGQQGKKACGD